jgi:protein-disulfide isomerase
MGCAARAQTGDTIVATVNGKSISQEEVDTTVVAQLSPLRQQIYAIRKIALENFIVRTILEDEAKRRGMSVEELGKQLTAARVEIPASEVEQVYLENANAFAAMSPEEAKQRIRLDLESQARMRNYREALGKLKEMSGVRILLAEPRLPTAAVSETAPAMGAAEAAVIITEFSDFQCPYCKQSQSALKQILRDHRDKVKLVFKHLPLDIHPQAFASARAAFCASEQNSFWQYHDALFDAENLSSETYEQIARRLGLKLPAFGDCFASETSLSAVLKDLREAQRLGINGTPAFVINGKLVRGSLSVEEFTNIVERELRSAPTTRREQKTSAPADN